jgi:hypothetical protein
MTVSTSTNSAAGHLSALDAAVAASREAHEAARALADAVLACQYLPAEVYQYAPDVKEAAATLTAATRALTSAAGYISTYSTQEHLNTLHQAGVSLKTAIAAAEVVVGALRSAAAWYTAALPSAQS